MSLRKGQISPTLKFCTFCDLRQENLAKANNDFLNKFRAELRANKSSNLMNYFPKTFFALYTESANS
jgi:hypothetical protein